MIKRLARVFRVTLLHSVAASLLVFLMAWCCAVLVFIVFLETGEPPILALLAGLTTQIIAEVVLCHDGVRSIRTTWILLFAFAALMVSPEIAGRYRSRVDELWSLSRLHFGAVTFSLLGGCIGACMHKLWVQSKQV